jgi:hypothetical protein
MEKMVTISEREYHSLRAAAELVRHPEALARTILAIKDQRTIALEDAFPSPDVAEHLKSFQSQIEDLLDTNSKPLPREDFEIENE